MARYYGWNDDICLLALNVSVEGPALRYFHILSSRGERMTFVEIASRFEQRFGKGTLQATSQVEFSFMTQEIDESLEQWADRVIETAQHALESLGRFFRNRQSYVLPCAARTLAQVGG